MVSIVTSLSIPSTELSGPVTLIAMSPAHRTAPSPARTWAQTRLWARVCGEVRACGDGVEEASVSCQSHETIGIKKMGNRSELFSGSVGDQFEAWRRLDVREDDGRNRLDIVDHFWGQSVYGPWSHVDGSNLRLAEALCVVDDERSIHGASCAPSYGCHDSGLCSAHDGGNGGRQRQRHHSTGDMGDCRSEKMCRATDHFRYTNRHCGRGSTTSMRHVVLAYASEMTLQ